MSYIIKIKGFFTGDMYLMKDLQTFSYDKKDAKIFSTRMAALKAKNNGDFWTSKIVKK